MFDAAECMFLYVESSLRVGTGEPGLEVDLPIVREQATGYPMVPGSSLKGVLRPRRRAAGFQRADLSARLRTGRRRCKPLRRHHLRFLAAAVSGALLDRPVRLDH